MVCYDSYSLCFNIDFAFSVGIFKQQKFTKVQIYVSCNGLMLQKPFKGI